ncbi:MAG TPA: hypothetical protein VHG51_16625, partial [Longimicrobiaceae bacterium]|nr:hypothetical protein [Longimicrobiaceae bacterium]
VSDDVLDQLPDGVPVICIVHNAFTSFSDAFVRRCDHFVCMTETAFRHQGGQVPAHKLALVHQGVDLQRFRPAPRGPRADRSVPRVLVCSRLEGFKRPVVEAVIDSLAPREVDLTVVGDGAAFWPISDRWGARITLINHIPCHSIHNFIPGFDVVVSSGRGVMEALACGVPALCAGFGYAGPVHADNVGALLEANLTGAGMGADTSRLVHDVQRAMDVDPQVCREVAERHFCVDRFVSALLRLAAGRRTA